tara:strand:- start:120 stop:722 length:603 start_codon:yes stop_codon:yes gene_type:complete
MKIIGIAGGSGCGKTFFTEKLIKEFPKKIEVIKLDSYYKDLSHIKFIEREKNNFDHPNSFEFDLLISNLNDLKKNDQVYIPIYDYNNHIRKKETYLLLKKKIIIIEGIYALYNENIRKRMDLKIFIDAEERIRLNRRIKRDTNSRGRTKASIINQYYKTVKPMHDKLISKTKNNADLVLKNNKPNNDSFNILHSKIKSFL